MIHVTAQITVKPGMVPTFLREFRDLSRLVRQEPGCLDYFPCLDAKTVIDGQERNPNCVVIIEKWASVATLESHLRVGHMRSFQERVKDIVEDVQLKILQEV